jgi:pilus assembly protein CpaB
MRRGTILTLGASAVFGMLAIFLARGFINKAVSSQYELSRNNVPLAAAKNIETEAVLVTNQDLEIGDELLPQFLRVTEYPLDALPAGSYQSFDQLFADPENPPIVLARMTENEPILGFKISGPGGYPSLSSMIADGKRAISIRVSDVSGVSGFLKPGDAVDISLTQEVDKNKKSRTRKLSSGAPEDYKAVFTTALLVQNVRVLGVGKQTNYETDTRDRVKTVTLEVTHKQAQKIALAQAVGQLNLALRGKGSDEILGPNTTLMSGLKLGSETVKRRVVRRAKVKSNTVAVTVIRNGQREQVSVFKENETKKLAGGSL